MNRNTLNRKKRYNGNKKPQQVQVKNNKKKNIEDFYFYIGSSKQAADFDITSELCINHIKKTYEYGDDISESLNNMSKLDTDVWFPSLDVSTSTNPATKAREDEENKIKFKAELDEAMRRKRSYRGNLIKA